MIPRFVPLGGQWVAQFCGQGSQNYWQC